MQLSHRYLPLILSALISLALCDNQFGNNGNSSDANQSGDDNNAASIPPPTQISDADLLKMPDLVTLPPAKSFNIVDGLYAGSDRKYKKVLSTAYSKMDTNDDGELTFDEMQTYFSQAAKKLGYVGDVYDSQSLKDQWNSTLASNTTDTIKKKDFISRLLSEGKTRNFPMTPSLCIKVFDKLQNNFPNLLQKPDNNYVDHFQALSPANQSLMRLLNLHGQMCNSGLSAPLNYPVEKCILSDNTKTNDDVRTCVMTAGNTKNQSVDLLPAQDQMSGLVAKSGVSLKKRFIVEAIVAVVGIIVSMMCFLLWILYLITPKPWNRIKLDYFPPQYNAAYNPYYFGGFHDDTYPKTSIYPEFTGFYEYTYQAWHTYTFYYMPDGSKMQAVRQLNFISPQLKKSQPIIPSTAPSTRQDKTLPF